MTYSPPDPAAFVARIVANPCCAAITEDDRLEEALASQLPRCLRASRQRPDARTPVRGATRPRSSWRSTSTWLPDCGADRASVSWLAGAGVDAVISSHGQLMAPIHHERMTAIHRLLLTRRSQLDTAIAAIGRSAPNIVELLPGVLLPSVAGRLPDFGVPLLAGSFVRTEADVAAVLAAGALGVATSAPALWGTPAGCSRDVRRRIWPRHSGPPLLPCVLIVSDGRHPVHPPPGLGGGVLVRDTDLAALVRRPGSDCPPQAVDVDGVAGLGADETRSSSSPGGSASA